MIKLNTLQYSKSDDLEISNNYSVSALKSNELYDDLCLQYNEKYNYNSLKTFCFLKEGFLGLLLELQGKIAVSVGETQALIDGAKLYESLGFEIHWVRLNKKAKIISNGTAHIDDRSDVLYFDNYKLNGFNVSGVLLFNDEVFSLLPIGQIDTIALKICFDALSKQNTKVSIKEIFIEELCKLFSGDVILFVNKKRTLENSVHFGLKGIKARELIRTMALNKIYLSNGEGCSLGLSKPSRIIQEMGYSEEMSRTSLSLSFTQDTTREEIIKFVEVLYLKYQQIKMLN